LFRPAAAHAGFCFCVNGSLTVKTKPARAALTLNKKARQEKRSPKLYLHNASYTQPILHRFIDVCVSAAYNWHYVLRASPNSRTPYAPEPGTKTAKKQSKGMQASHWPTRSKKARPRQVPLKFLI